MNLRPELFLILRKQNVLFGKQSSWNILILLLFPLNGFSQSMQDSAPKTTRDSAYLAKMDTVISIRLNINTRHWLQELLFGRVQGFYLYNTGDFLNGWSRGTDPYIQSAIKHL